MIRKSLFVIVAAFGLTSCLNEPKESDITILGREQEKIMDEYVAANNLTGRKEALYDFYGNYYPVFTMIETKGDTITKYDKNQAIWIAYTIKTLDNRVVETVKQEDSVFVYAGGYANKILGLSVASTNFLGNGGKGSFILPSTLGYGGNPPGGVEYNALLKVDVQVVNRLSEADQLNFFIKKNKINITQSTETGLLVAKTKETTDSLAVGPSVTVKYVGKFPSGVVFDKSETGATFQLTGVVPGFSEAIKIMRRGEKVTAFLPSALGYKETGYMSIPGYMPLIFEIELVQHK